MTAVNLLDFDGKGLADFFLNIGEKPFRAKQVMRWIHRFGVADFEQMSDLSRSLRD
ncbi:MAG: 23S rRNA (adenine(2503)-C(2))-methyltransferase RlmN, partial [Burkholderiales bacterium]